MRLARELSLYLTGWASEREEAVVHRFRAFLESSADAFERSHPPGHFTGSALLVTADLASLALMHHRKLDRWLQFGGHADGNPELPQVALRETEEESRIADLHFVPFEDRLGLDYHPLPLDLDVHEIPARGAEPAHLHYDVRYLLFTHRPQDLQANAESHALGWFTPQEARGLTDEPSMLRMFDKLDWLREVAR